MENRLIKFRAWCSGTHKGLTFVDDVMDYEVCLSPKGFYLDVESGWDIQGEYPTIPIMQYTGLQDKNGKDIYEGDIVCDDKYQSFFWRGVVKFSHGVFGAEWLGTEKNQSMVGSWRQKHNLRKLDDDILERLIVIGNIYENPKLLCK